MSQCRCAVDSPAHVSKHHSIPPSEDQVASYLKRVSHDGVETSVVVACINSPLNCTLSGPEDALDAIKTQADTDSIFAQKVKTGVAYHSESMQAISDEYRSLMGDLEPRDGEQDLKSASRKEA